MQCLRLEKFELGRNPISGDLRILADGSEEYKSVLGRAYPQCFFSMAFKDKHQRFDWGTYVKGADEQVEQSIKSLLERLQKAVYIKDDLTECYALDYHTKPGRFRLGRTELGELVHAAKPYNMFSGDRTKAGQVAKLLGDFIKTHPTYGRADFLVAAPGSNRQKRFDLPSVIVDELARITRLPDRSGLIMKKRQTQPMKDFSTMAEKIDNVREAFCLSEDATIQEKSVIIVDDIYHSGATINELGRVLFEAGASEVLGLVATKTFKHVREKAN